MSVKSVYEEKGAHLMTTVCHIYLISAALGSMWRIIGSTNDPLCVGEDLSTVLDIPKGELEFASEMLTENIEMPLAFVCRQNGEYFPIIVMRNSVFDTSTCMALCFDTPADETFAFLFSRGIDSAISSPLSLDLVRSYDSVKPFSNKCFDVARVIREAWALGDISEKGRVFGASVLEELALCIGELFSVKITLSVSDIRLCDSDNGRVFSMGFCTDSLVFMAMAARSCYCDGDVRVHAFCGNGHVTLDISFDAPLGGECIGADMFTDIAENYGIPIDIRAENGRIRCTVMPEYADEALEGVKEHILSIRDFIDSFA